MTRATLKATLCICLLGIGACDSKDSADIKKLHADLEVSKAENARLKTDLEGSKAENARLKTELEALKSGSEEEFTDGGDFARVIEFQ